MKSDRINAGKKSNNHSEVNQTISRIVPLDVNLQHDREQHPTNIHANIHPTKPLRQTGAAVDESPVRLHYCVDSPVEISCRMSSMNESLSIHSSSTDSMSTLDSTTGSTAGFLNNNKNNNDDDNRSEDDNYWATYLQRELDKLSLDSERPTAVTNNMHKTSTTSVNNHLSEIEDMSQVLLRPEAMDRKIYSRLSYGKLATDRHSHATSRTHGRQHGKHGKCKYRLVVGDGMAAEPHATSTVTGSEEPVGLGYITDDSKSNFLQRGQQLLMKIEVKPSSSQRKHHGHCVNVIRQPQTLRIVRHKSIQTDFDGWSGSISKGTQTTANFASTPGVNIARCSSQCAYPTTKQTAKMMPTKRTSAGILEHADCINPHSKTVQSTANGNPASVGLSKSNKMYCKRMPSTDHFNYGNQQYLRSTNHLINSLNSDSCAALHPRRHCPEVVNYVTTFRDGVRNSLVVDRQTSHHHHHHQQQQQQQHQRQTDLLYKQAANGIHELVSVLTNSEEGSAHTAVGRTFEVDPYFYSGQEYADRSQHASIARRSQNNLYQPINYHSNHNSPYMDKNRRIVQSGLPKRSNSAISNILNNN